MPSTKGLRARRRANPRKSVISPCVATTSVQIGLTKHIPYWYTGQFADRDLGERDDDAVSRIRPTRHRGRGTFRATSGHTGSLEVGVQNDATIASDKS